MYLAKLAKTCVAFLCSTLALCAPAQTNVCGPLHLPGKYGPFDYRAAGSDQRYLVEHAHFTNDVAELRKPMFQYFGPDLHYTLWSFPNHHRALITLINLTQKEKSQQPSQLPLTAECYFERALRFKSDDLIVRMIYVMFLKTVERKDDALAQLDFVAENAGDAPMTHYNSAKLYFELGQYEKAEAAMQTAAKQGAPYVDLIEKLKQAGHWKEEK